MGLLKDGTVVPTPRDRVMAVEDEAIFHQMGLVAVAFEIWTTTQEIYTGTSVDEWKDCESEEVQWMMLRLQDGSIQEVTGVEEYRFKGAAFPKKGPWMDDVEYFKALPEFVAGTSKLI
jgi:hypothetical protein